MLYNNIARRFALFVTDPDDGKGGDQDLGGGGPNQAEAVVTSLLARAGITVKEVPEGARKVMRRLAKENFNYRDKNRQLQERAAPEGAVILQGEEAELFKAVKDLGLKGEDIKKAVSERDEFKTQITTFQRNEVVRQAAEALTYKPSVLTDLVTSKGLEVEMREVEIEGEKKTLPHVKIAGGDKVELLSVYAERDLKDYLPALRSKEAQDSGGVHYPAQSASGDAPKQKNAVDAVLGDYVVPSARSKTT